MCQVALYLDDEKIMDDVIWFEPDGDGFLSQTFFEEPVHVKGSLRGIDLKRNRILLTATEQEASHG